MAYDDGLAERVRDYLADRPGTQEKKMFGGLCFLVEGHMVAGISGDDLMVRVGPDAHAEVLTLPHTRPMDFTGRPMRGFAFVEPDGTAEDEDLARWLDRCLAFTATLPPKA